MVVSYGSSTLLEEGLLPVARRAPDLTVVVVDNFSSAGERTRMRSLCVREGWRLVAPGGNTGFGVGADLGIAEAVRAGCEAVVLLNPDARAEPAVLRELLGAVHADRDLLLSPTVTLPDGSPWFVRGRLDLHSGRTSTRGGGQVGAGPAAVPWLSGACLAASVEGWQMRGGFDPGYFLYWEDVELSLRWQRSGGRVEVRADLVVVHDVGGTQEGPAGKSPLYVRRNCRNRLLLAGQLGRATYLRWLRLAPSYGWETVRRGGRKRLLRRPGLLVAALRGTIEGAVMGAGAVLGTTGR